MVEQDVLGTQGGEDVRRGRGLDLGQVAVGAGDELRVLQLGPVDAVDAEEAGEVQGAGERVDLRLADLQLAYEEVQDLTVDGLLDLQADGRAQAAPHQLLLQAWSRFSASSSSTSRPSLRVRRKVWCSRASMPGNSSSRWAAMTSSTGT